MKTPVLMVHGMCCTGEVWSRFRSFFEARGTPVYTPTLRPSLRVRLSERPPRELRDLRLSDYVDELELEVHRIVAETGMKPAVMGHSMGGLLCQALAARSLAAAAVFISPAAPAGIRTLRSAAFWAAFAIARRRGWTAGVIRPHPQTLAMIVLNALPIAERAAVHGAMVYESGGAFADFANFPVDESLVRVPVLTIAAGRDRLISTALARLTARKYAPGGGEFREYPNHGHWLYSEPGWEVPANDIYNWLAKVTEASIDGTVRAASFEAEAQQA